MITKDELVSRMIDRYGCSSGIKLIACCYAIDWVLKDYKDYDISCIDNDRYTDDLTLKYAIEYGLCEDVSKMRTNDELPEQLALSVSGLSWVNLAEDLGILDTTLGELRKFCQDEHVSFTGLMADTILRQAPDDKKQSIATAIFFARLKDYQVNERHNDRFLWYLTYDGKIGKCPFNGENKWAITHLKNGDIEYDSALRFYVATRELNGEGCCFVRHRRLLAQIGTEWNGDWVKRIEEYLDGGQDCKMIIDRDFALAYQPDYNDSSTVLDGDFVCGYSCMSGRGDEAQTFYGGIDGCYVARFENADGEQVGRCLIYQLPDGRRHFIRLYALAEYQNKANMMIKQEMKEGDIRGRGEKFDGMTLHTNWDEDTPNMYLDGNRYGVKVVDGQLCVGTDYCDDCKSTSGDRLCDVINLHRCEHCGEWCNDPMEIDGCYFCCEDCAESEGYHRCERCGNWEHEDSCAYVECDDRWYCCEYCAERDGYRKCYDCGTWGLDDDMIADLQGHRYCDDTCAERAGCKKDQITGDWTVDYLPTTTGFVDAKLFLQHRDEFTIKITRKRNNKKDEQNETNND